MPLGKVAVENLRRVSDLSVFGSYYITIALFFQGFDRDFI